MRKGLLGLDHAMISTLDLQATRRTFQRLGFTVTPYRTNEPMGGGTTGGKGGNHLVLFRPTDSRMTNFLELAYADPQYAMPLITRFLHRPPTLAMIVHATDALDSLNAEWQAAGFPPYVIHEQDTQFRDPETGRADRIHFKVMIPTALKGPLLFNACEVIDRSHYLRADWISHANGAQHWTEVIVSTPNPGEMRAHFNAIYGIELPPQGEITVVRGEQRLTALSAEDFAATFGAFGQRADGSAADTVVRIAVESLAKTRSFLQGGHVDFVDSNAMLTIPAQQAAGIILQLHEQIK